MKSEKKTTPSDKRNNPPVSISSIEYEAGLINYINDAVIAMNTQFQITIWNHAAEMMYGWRAAEVMGRISTDIIRSDLTSEKQEEALQQLRELGAYRSEVIQYRKDGVPINIETNTMTLYDEHQQAIGILTVNRNITERKRSEAAFKKAQLELEATNKELEAFSYSVSHDLRAPLRTIDGFSQALLEDYEKHLPEEAQGYLSRIRSAAQRMAELIDDLLNLSHVTRSVMKFVPVDLSKIVQSIVKELHDAHRERNVNIIITPNLKAQGDPSLLQAVFENLLNNAWKFTSKQEQAKIEFASKHENGETVYFIRDNGAGFDMTYANKLFGAFQRLHAMTEFPGTGIGLATVQRIIHRHGGRIWAESQVGQGATFFFTLPALDAAKQKIMTQEKETLAERIKEII